MKQTTLANNRRLLVVGFGRLLQPLVIVVVVVVVVGFHLAHNAEQCPWGYLSGEHKPADVRYSWRYI